MPSGHSCLRLALHDFRLDRRRDRPICAHTIQARRAAGCCDTMEAGAGRSYHRGEVWNFSARLPQSLFVIDLGRVLYDLLYELDFINKTLSRA